MKTVTKSYSIPTPAYVAAQVGKNIDISITKMQDSVIRIPDIDEVYFTSFVIMVQLNTPMMFDTIIANTQVTYRDGKESFAMLSVSETEQTKCSNSSFHVLIVDHIVSQIDTWIVEEHHVSAMFGTDAEVDEFTNAITTMMEDINDTVIPVKL